MVQGHNWLPAGYKVPKPVSDYLKLVDGANKFRIMSAPLMGYEYWNGQGKPVRSAEAFEEIPADIRLDQKTGEPEKIKHFWAFIVWSYEAKRLQVLEITQYSIQQQVQAYVSNPDWGSPTDYDLTISRSKESGFVKYNVQTSPPKPAPVEALKAMETSKIDLKKLLEGEEIVPRDEALDAFDKAVDDIIIE